MTATQVTVDKNILFSLQSFSLNVTRLRYTEYFHEVKKNIIRF